MNKLKKMQGITLIALVITIIVLLILAGVSIAMLTGDNGILTKASSAKEKTRDAQELEQIQLAYLAATTNTTGEVDKEVLYAELDKITPSLDGLPTRDATTKELPDLPWNIKGESGQEHKITVEGVKELVYVKVEQIAANPKAYYGKKVENYKANDNDTNTYRIFYVDAKGDFGDGENTIYLKADYNNIDYGFDKNESYDMTNSKVKSMNINWANARGTATDWNTSELAAAYLCLPVNKDNYLSTTLPWGEYYNENEENVNYVIGAPSLEMYVKSYNQAYLNESDTYILGAEYKETNTYGYIYTLNGSKSTISGEYYSTGSGSLDYKKYNSMYCGKDGKQKGTWWLATPLDYWGGATLCSVSGSGTQLHRLSYATNEYGVSPIVSMNSNFNIQIEQ